MLFKVLTSLSFGLLASAAVIPTQVERLAARVEERDSVCTNGPSTRSCWKVGFSIATDFDDKAPPEGQTRTYNLEITNTTADLDGAGGKLAMLINNQFPGPTIIADWGDTLVVNVKNSLQDNGTSIHWHGIRQLNSCQNDGVNGVTECPIAPGETKTYTFKATQFGTAWYHSHHSAQYGDGIVGTMIINGPATSNYDYDLGTLPITDFFYLPAFELNERAQHSLVGPPVPDNILVNGTMKNANGGGNYFNMTVTKGKKYRIRLINTSVDSFFHVSMDGHPFTVITSDLVPIKPYTTDQLAINIGQRYDIIIKADQTVDNYWFRVGVATDCGTNAMLTSGIQIGAILHYDGASDSEPASTGVTLKTTCADEQGLTPWVKNMVPSEPLLKGIKEISLDYKVDAVQNNLFRWLINGSDMQVDWAKPSIEYALNGQSNDLPKSNIFTMPKANEWSYWWIQTTSLIEQAHPIHLHGHDFYLLGHGDDVWDGTTSSLTFNNPTRRDVATLSAGGWMIVAFPADNPGAWVMHCHIAWHASQGLSMQFLERPDEIKGSIGDTSAFTEGCKSWNKYWDAPHPYEMTDSGLRKRLSGGYP